MTIFSLDEILDTSSTDSQVPDSDESNVSAIIDSGELVYNEFIEESSSDDEESREEAVTEIITTSSVDYTEPLESIEANTRVILYVLLLCVAFFFLILTYKLYSFLMR